MPGMDGVAGVRRVRDAAPLLPLVVASGQDDPATIRAVLAAGVAGFIPKTESCDVVLHAIRLVRSGGVYVPAQMLARSFRATAGRPGDSRAADEADGMLTPRQIDVLTQLLRGQPNKLIARELGLTEGTVKIHVAAILRTLRARNRTEAVVRARELGLAAR
jgi:DNA-binding NarL/FixJ family response regulator